MLLLALASVLAGVRSPNPGAEVHRIVLAPGDTVVATSQGSGPAVVFVPGLLGNSFAFRKVAPAVADSGFRSLIVEPLGTGNSSRPRGADYTLEAQARRVGASLAQLGVGEAWFVCHSVAASICLRLALQEPDLVLGIVSINGGPDERAATAGLKTAIRLAPLIKLFGAGRIIRGRVKGGLQESSADESWVTDDVVAGYTAPFRSLDATLRATQAMSEAVEPDSLLPRLPAVAAPVLMLVGTGSERGAPRPEAVAALAAGLPRFRADTVPAAGQHIHEERPERVIAAVLGFVRGGGVEAQGPD
jgi:pimeloyl-ACP methyl ester carboxylesterase